MSFKTVVFFLEEESAKAMLEVIVPKICNSPEVDKKYIVFQGKQDFDKKIENKLKCWLNCENVSFILLRDKDSADCLKLKQELLEKCKNSGKAQYCTIRIPCHELETFYLGDLDAVEKAFKRNLANFKNKRKFQNPDALGNPQQMLLKLTDDEYQQIGGSRNIARHMKLDDTNKSKSFQVLLRKLKETLLSQ